MVIVDIDNQDCDELCFSYQICKNDDETYYVYQSHGLLRGQYLARNLETLAEAWAVLNDALECDEGLNWREFA